MNFNLFLVVIISIVGFVCSDGGGGDERTPTLLISLDGFRADKLDDFLNDNPSSYLRQFVNVGVKADYMKPSFPTLTVPNHYTIVTGLYSENHGIVGNIIYDDFYDEKSYLLKDPNRNDIKWWNKTEPIWLTAKKQGLKTSSFFWPGSEVWSQHPDIFLSYNERYSYESRCDEVISWFKKFNIDFGLLYFDEPDHTGHSYGPDSAEYENMIHHVDKTIGYLMGQLEKENLLDKINIIVLSDHGMAQMNNYTIYIQWHVNDMNLIESNKTIYGVVSNIYPTNDLAKEQIYNSLKEAEYLKVYYKEDIPERFHFKDSNRVGPIVVIADEGYILSNRTETLLGHHGFDNELESMRTVFMARGPNFKQNLTINNLKNVDVYPLLCDLLKIECHENNGSILPFENVLKKNEILTSTIATTKIENSIVTSTTTLTTKILVTDENKQKQVSSSANLFEINYKITLLIILNLIFKFNY